MDTLTITSKGQVTLRKEVLRHLGVAPGAKVEMELLPDGRVELRPAAKPGGTIHSFLGVLAGKTRHIASIEEINEAAAAGWAGEV
jgi:AbrB family looped-hinge helix DNA binding protein